MTLVHHDFLEGLSPSLYYEVTGVLCPTLSSNKFAKLRSRNHILPSYGVHTDQIFLAFSFASLNIITAWKKNFKTTCRTITRKLTGDMSQHPLHVHSAADWECRTQLHHLQVSREPSTLLCGSHNHGFQGSIPSSLLVPYSADTAFKSHWFGPSALYLTKHKVK